MRSPRVLKAAAALFVLGAIAAVAVAVLARESPETDPPELGRDAGLWPAPNQNLSSTRATPGSPITSSTVSSLRPVWRFRFPGRPGPSGILASTPLAVGGRVYVQDLNSGVYALDLASGRLVWETRPRAPNTGPNGLAFGYGRVYAATDAAAFALDAKTGRRTWRTRLAGPSEQFVQTAPLVADGLVYMSTVGLPPGGRGALYALDADDGRIIWRFATIREPWRFPRLAGGGGAWYPPSADGEGRVYTGTSNPGPWGGTPELPNGAAFPGPVPYTDSLLALDARTGELLWHDQVTPHDVRDHDFQLSPILAASETDEGERELLIGGGKAGRVMAWDRETRERLWEAEVGMHRNDSGPLPRREVAVCPGLLGGVETPMAYSAGRVFAAVVDLCARGSATSYDRLRDLDPASGTGRLVALEAATGQRLWERRLRTPAFGCATVASDVVFTTTYGGVVRAFQAEDGVNLWRARLRAGSNSCPAVAGDTLLAGAGVPRAGARRSALELVAFRLEG
ncbi:MAG: PQQ-binding-like beta-propeller repeat protein [Solirubrobacterales bacterium]|nr:PQQ-binding-like beta-propeller repeat protein [Solirubrobacterales bacterium]